MEWQVHGMTSMYVLTECQKKMSTFSFHSWGVFSLPEPPSMTSFTLHSPRKHNIRQIRLRWLCCFCTRLLSTLDCLVSPTQLRPREQLVEGLSLRSAQSWEISLPSSFALLWKLSALTTVRNFIALHQNQANEPTRTLFIENCLQSDSLRNFLD